MLKPVSVKRTKQKTKTARMINVFSATDFIMVNSPSSSWRLHCLDDCIKPHPQKPVNKIFLFLRKNFHSEETESTAAEFCPPHQNSLANDFCPQQRTTFFSVFCSRGQRQNNPEPRRHPPRNQKHKKPLNKRKFT